MSSERIEKNPVIQQLSGVAPFLVSKDNPVGWCIATFAEFALDSQRLLQKCTKPDARQFKKIAMACSIGFAIMGFIG
jgi:protein transport protein SEC61 subunit gamma and related proteins